MQKASNQGNSNTTCTMVSSPEVPSTNINNKQQVSMTLVSADRKQQQINRSEIYDHFEYDHNLRDYDCKSAIARFYKGRNVFITGASGFVGKCLLEKLIRSCAGINNVYILLRPKKGVDIEERLNVLLQSALFSRLRESPNAGELLKKIKAIRGDITEPMFGISDTDIELLSSEVSVVFHSAATVKFVEPLKVAVSNNVVSVGNMVELASKLEKLEALVHVSTAYSNCDRETVDEIFYKEPMEAEKLIEMSRWMDPKMFENIAPVLIGDRPNTYTFTKAVAESLLVKRSRKLIPHIPIAMIRPSIVAGTWQQPIKGWVDNFNGPTGVILSMSTGALQAMPCSSSYCADIVPVDIVANLIICSACRVTKERQKRDKRESENWPKFDENDSDIDEEGVMQGNELSSNISIFNCVSSTLNPIIWDDVLKHVKTMSKQYPLNHPFRNPGFMLMSNDYLFTIYNFFSHKCVAHLSDFCLKLIGKKPSLVIIYSRLNKMVATLRPFTTNQWLFDCKNVTGLYESLSPIDKEIFNFDIRQVAWEDYIKRYYVGSKIFALKDDPNTLSNARHKYKRMKTSSRLAQLLFLLLAYYVLLNGTFLEQYIWQSIESLLFGVAQQYHGDSSTTTTSTSALDGSSTRLKEISF